MTTSKVRSAILCGTTALPVDVECTLMHAEGTSIVIRGLSEFSAKEAQWRVLAALRVAVPGELITGRYDVTVRFASDTLYDLSGSHAELDLAIAVACYSASTSQDLGRSLIVGELTHEGSVLPVRGALAFGEYVRAFGLPKLICPWRNAEEAVLSGANVVGAITLREAIDILRGVSELRPIVNTDARPFELLAPLQIRQDVRERLEVAMKARESVLFVGPPGTGKTMLARRCVEMLGAMTHEERLDVVRNFSSAGLTLSDSGRYARAQTRPFRAPHFTVSNGGLFGTGTGSIRVGEVTLAHHGILFLDEVAELRKPTLQTLVQVVCEKRSIVNHRARGVELPADFVCIGSTQELSLRIPAGLFKHVIELDRTVVSSTLVES